MISLILALSMATPTSPILEPAAACRLARKARILPGKVYSLRGTYFGGEHGAEIELPKCDATIAPMLAGNAESIVANWHEAYRDKCKTWLHGEYIRGVFTGTFARRNMRVPLTNMFLMTELFTVIEVESPDLDIASIKCGPAEPAHSQ